MLVELLDLSERGEKGGEAVHPPLSISVLILFVQFEESTAVILLLLCSVHW